jgi:hypothetical protein
MSAAILTIDCHPAHIDTKHLSKVFDQISEEGYGDGSVQKRVYRLQNGTIIGKQCRWFHWKIYSRGEDFWNSIDTLRFLIKLSTVRGNQKGF